MKALFLFSVLSTLSVGCFRFTEEAAKTIDGGSDSSVEDTAVADTAPPPLGNTICSRLTGGYTTVQKAMNDLMPKLKADCRIDRFFLTLDATKSAHMIDCMARQLGSVMSCADSAGLKMKYPTVDSKGVQCKDMLNAHKTLGIHPEDFDGMIDDILAVLADAKMSAADIALVADVLRFQRQDIVNPGDAGRGDACASEASAPVDTGEEY